MPLLELSFRCGTIDDVACLADFVEFASEGLALYLWSNMAGPGGDPWQVGRERIRTGAVGLSYENAVVAESDGRPAAGLIGYPLERKPAASPDLPAVLRPLQELMSEAAGTWYVHVLAAYPQSRGRGYGAALLGIADRRAAAAGKRAMSLIVSDTNAGARRLYERCGYAEAGRRRIVKGGWRHPGVDWVLLKKAIG